MFLWKVMLVLALAFAAGCVGQLTSQGFYALGDTKTPTRIGIVTFTVYVPLKFLAFRAFGIYGLATATGLFGLVNVLLQSSFLRRRLRALRAPRRHGNRHRGESPRTPRERKLAARARSARRVAARGPSADRDFLNLDREASTDFRDSPPLLVRELRSREDDERDVSALQDPLRFPEGAQDHAAV